MRIVWAKSKQFYDYLGCNTCSDSALRDMLGKSFGERKCWYEMRRLQVELAVQGYNKVGRAKIRSLMTEMELQAMQPRSLCRKQPKQP